MDIYDLWLAKTKVSFKVKLELYKKFRNSKNIWYYIFNNCNNNYENDLVITNLKESWNEYELNLTMEFIEKKEIKAVKIDDSLYPSKLLNIEDAPFLLFYKGNIKRLNSSKSIAIVGSREASVYGRNAAAFISSELSRHDVNIISGMARGIDTYAHKNCIENKGFTCAVLGCGIDIIYPRENTLLYHEIINTGCIISEFMPGTSPLPYNFPVRNRIISGLSDGVIVVEANLKSGSLITAGTASEQGREVFAVPGSIFSKESAGTNRLLKDGASPFTDIKDLFDILKINFVPKYAHVFYGNNRKILDIVKDSPVHIDDIIKLTNIDIKQLYELLFELQLKNEILCLAGNYYVRSSDKL